LGDDLISSLFSYSRIEYYCCQEHSINQRIMRTVIICFLFLAFGTANAQITEGSKSMSQGMKNALVLELPGVEDAFVEKLWKKYIKPSGGKTKKNRSEWFTDDASLASVGGSNTVDIYMSPEELGPDINMNVWFDLGGAFLNSEEHPNRYVEAEKYLMRFALFMAKEKTQLELESQEKTMGKTENLLKRLERDNERYHRDIEVAKEKIRLSESNIETNLVEQEETRKLIEAQLVAIEKIRAKLQALN